MCAVTANNEDVALEPLFLEIRETFPESLKEP